MTSMEPMQPTARASQSQEDFNRKYGARYESYGLHIKKIIRNRLRPYLNSSGDFSCRRFTLKTALRLCPLTWLVREYISHRGRDLLYDALAGLTVFAMCVPQSLAYGQLSGLGAVFGLYTATFPLLVYFVLGSSRHLSVGVEAATSIVAGAAVMKLFSQPLVDIKPILDVPVQDLSPKVQVCQSTSQSPVNITATLSADFGTSSPPPATTHVPSFYLYRGENFTRLEMLVAVNASLTLLVGVFQLAMFVLRLGFLTALFSNAMMCGYTTGVAVHVFSSQISYILGYRVHTYHGPLNLVCFYWDLFSHIRRFNGLSFAIGVLSLLALVLTRTLLQRRLERFRWYPPISFPTPLLLVIFGTAVSYTIQLERAGIVIIGPILAGFPQPVLPKPRLWPVLWFDALLLALLSYTLSISLARIYAKKHGYTIDANQVILVTCRLLLNFENFGLIVLDSSKLLEPSIALSLHYSPDQMSLAVYKEVFFFTNLG